MYTFSITPRMRKGHASLLSMDRMLYPVHMQQVWVSAKAVDMVI